MTSFTLPRRQALAWLAATAAASALPARAQAGGWRPSETVTFNIGVAAGGTVDLYARGIKTTLEALDLLGGQTVLPDNKPGAAGLLALRVMQNQVGNAHHLASFHTGSIAGQVTGMLRADMRDFVPVAMMVEETSLVAVAANSPLQTAADLLAALRRDPTSVRIAVAPVRGLNTHLAIAKPLQKAGIDVARLTVVPFRSSGESMTALLGGHVELVSATAPVVVPHAEAGRARMLASAAAARGQGPLSGVPTWREQGVDADYVSYNGVLLPPGVTVEQIRFWEQALRRVAEAPAWKALVEKSGNKPIFKGYVDSHRYLQRELQETQALVAALGTGAR